MTQVHDPAALVTAVVQTFVRESLENTLQNRAGK